MYYLVDTNVFLHDLTEDIFAVADSCKKKGNDVCVTQTIIDELDPGYYREENEVASKEIYNSVKNLSSGSMGFKVINVINMSEVTGASQELKKIRERFYGWMKNPTYLQHLIDEGILTREEISKPNFRKKDLGECELIAIARASNGEYWVITNDKGRVFKHPDINIFDVYMDDIVILSGREWLEKINCQEKNIC